MCVISYCLYWPIVRSPSLSLLWFPFSYLICSLVPSPVSYQSPFGLAHHLYSAPCPLFPLSLLTSTPQPLKHSAKKASLFHSILLWPVYMCVCVSVFVCDRGVWVILFERTVKASVTAVPLLCWPSGFSDFSPPQLSRMERRQATVPVSITSLDI